MGDVSEYFSRKEFACKCGCGFDAVDIELLSVLEDLRWHFSAPITITSGCRCAYYNEQVGGALNSKHVHAKAADIQVSGVDPKSVWGYLVGKYPFKYGIGLYNSWVHIDVRKEKARWDKSNG